MTTSIVNDFAAIAAAMKAEAPNEELSVLLPDTLPGASMLRSSTNLPVSGPPGGRHQASDRDRDAEPIRACHEFAVRELTDEYRFPIGLHVDDDFDDVDRYKWIAATPATTVEEWQAKAIALSAWSGRAYFADEPDGTGMRRFSRPCFRT